MLWVEPPKLCSTESQSVSFHLPPHAPPNSNLIYQSASLINALGSAPLSKMAAVFCSRGTNKTTAPSLLMNKEKSGREMNLKESSGVTNESLYKLIRKASVVCFW